MVTEKEVIYDSQYGPVNYHISRRYHASLDAMLPVILFYSNNLETDAECFNKSP